MQKCSECGRSILETLTVIIIMILLLCGALYLWKTTQDKHKVYVITQHVMQIASERRANIDSQLNRTSWNKRSEHLHYPNVTLTVVNGCGEENKDYFWIAVSKIDSALCKHLSKIKKEEIGAVKIEPEDRGICDFTPENIFYFPKFERTGGNPDRNKQTSDCS